MIFCLWKQCHKLMGKRGSFRSKANIRVLLHGYSWWKFHFQPCENDLYFQLSYYGPTCCCSIIEVMWGITYYKHIKYAGHAARYVLKLLSLLVVHFRFLSAFFLKFSIQNQTDWYSWGIPNATEVLKITQWGRSFLKNLYHRLLFFLESNSLADW